MARSGLRVLRFVVVATLLIVVLYKLSTERVNFSDYVPMRSSNGSSAPSSTNLQGSTGGISSGNKDDTSSEQKELQEEKSNDLLDHSKDLPQSPVPYQRANATFVTLARNGDLWSLINSIRVVEDRFNNRYHYDWVFLNDQEFNEEFKKTVTAFVSGNVKFGLIPKEHWGFPDWIDQDKAALVREEMRKNKIIYGDSVSYRHMCRYESGFFWRHPALDEYKYYWRVEPDIKLYCDIKYDLFKFMEERDLKYGFTISLYEYEATIPTLWETTKKFIDENPQYVASDPLTEFYSDDEGKTYNRCHFWSNFEIASLDFWRGEAYSKYFEYLDKAGGFFYERWGDAPVHSLGAALFLNKDEVHFFDDVGYFHVPFSNCPTTEAERLDLRCTCKPEDNFTWRGYSCTPRFYTMKNLQRPEGWAKQSE